MALSSRLPSSNQPLNTAFVRCFVVAAGFVFAALLFAVNV
jgi:hypothetical protein